MSAAALPHLPHHGAPVQHLRLTRRGRLVVFTIALAIVLAAFLWLSAPAVSTHEVHQGPTTTVVVGPGQTLWDIAEKAAPGADTREVVADIIDLNALPETGALQVGERLAIPRY